MKKLINDVATVLTESLDGFVAAHADLVTLGEDHKFVLRLFYDGVQPFPGATGTLDGEDFMP